MSWKAILPSNLDLPPENQASFAGILENLLLSEQDLLMTAAAKGYIQFDNVDWDNPNEARAYSRAVYEGRITPTAEALETVPDLYLWRMLFWRMTIQNREPIIYNINKTVLTEFEFRLMKAIVTNENEDAGIFQMIFTPDKQGVSFEWLQYKECAPAWDILKVFLPSVAFLPFPYWKAVKKSGLLGRFESKWQKYLEGIRLQNRRNEEDGETHESEQFSKVDEIVNLVLTSDLKTLSRKLIALSKYQLEIPDQRLLMKSLLTLPKYLWAAIALDPKVIGSHKAEVLSSYLTMMQVNPNGAGFAPWDKIEFDTLSEDGAQFFTIDREVFEKLTPEAQWVALGIKPSTSVRITPLGMGPAEFATLLTKLKDSLAEGSIYSDEMWLVPMMIDFMALAELCGYPLCLRSLKGIVDRKDAGEKGLIQHVYESLRQEILGASKAGSVCLWVVSQGKPVSELVSSLPDDDSRKKLAALLLKLGYGDFSEDLRETISLILRRGLAKVVETADGIQVEGMLVESEI